MIAICVCSRGLVHSRTMEAIEANRKGWSTELFFTHADPIPQAQNNITIKALLFGPRFLWFVEEDMLPTPGTLSDLMAHGAKTKADVVIADYRVNHDARAIHRTADGRVLFGGMGCMLVAAHVFRKIDPPWFDTRTFRVDEHTGVFTPTGETASYGGQDVWFFNQCHKANISIVSAPIKAGHLRVKGMQTPHTNQGTYDVETI